MFNRLQQWQSFKYDILGELYYDMVYAYGQGDPWSSLYYFGGNGDGTLYYPGRPDKIGGATHIPVESIRLKLIREGMEDYEYISLLKMLDDLDFATQQNARVVTNTHSFTKDPAVLYEAREKMALQIISHVPAAPGEDGSSNPNPPAPGNSGDGSSAIPETPPSVEPASGAGGLLGNQVAPSANGGGGCTMTIREGPVDFSQAVSFLLLYFFPFIGSFYKMIRRFPGPIR